MENANYQNNGYQQQPCNNNDPFQPSGPEGKCRGVAAILAIFLGGLGIQYFYMGKTTAGILTILLTFVTCSVWSLVMFVQGIIMFTQTNSYFEEKYIRSTSTLPLF